MSIELPHSPNFDKARERLESVLRGRADIFGPRHVDEDGEIGELIPGAMLNDWLLISNWIDDEGFHHYCRVNSNMPEHALKGLKEMFDD
jgi:hypothetical protein